MKHFWTRIGLGLLTALFFVFSHPAAMAGTELPSVEDVVGGKAPLPTIEDLTSGKVKKGDLIDKSNVELVKGYLSVGSYECVKRGLVFRIGTQLPPEQIVPKYFIEATKRNRGKAIMDENGTVYYNKAGALWPGGLPFPIPKTGLEVAANVKFGTVWDDLRNYPVSIMFIDSKGRNYKRVDQNMLFTYCNTRTQVPPLGSIPGYEKIMFKRLIVITFPLELKGVGQYTVRYYDDAKNYDTGFAYLPAFKRTIRVSATTWQDNIAGSDPTYQDGQGISDPYSNWDFRLIEPRYILMPEPKSPVPLLDEKGEINGNVQFNVGRKFPRIGWTVWPMYMVEAVPRAKNIYGKKVAYVNAWPYWPSILQFGLIDMYDRQMKLWKTYISHRGNHYVHNGEPYTTSYMNLVYDLQADHMSQFWMLTDLNRHGYKPQDITMKTLLKAGR
ncbi:MAG: DUF1329 domain-containing protein [Thermodesulfobacteriota bacterium]|nr:DUF1329 domain-containing protein [Thermodesulfobacteriota bacterium]